MNKINNWSRRCFFIGSMIITGLISCITIGCSDDSVTGSEENGASSGGSGIGSDSQVTGGVGANGVSSGSGGTAAIGGNAAVGGTVANAGSVASGGNIATGGVIETGGTGAIAGERGQGTGGGTSAQGGTGGSTSAQGGTGAQGGAGGDTDAQSGAGGSSGDANGSDFGTVAVEDLDKDGAYPATTTEENVGPNNNYTIYRPQELAPNGAKNPVVVWISGGGSHHSQYTLLPHLATHGFMIIASNTIPGMGTQVALGEEMVAAVDWIVEEAELSGSDYYGKVDATKVAAMGYSMGGLASTAAAADPRWTTTVHISGGAGNGSVRNLHAPAAFICGASGVDIAGANCATDFEQATTPVFYAVFNGGDHLGVRTPPYSDRIAAVVTGWLRWQLMNDQTLKSMFVGDQCTVCMDSNWTVQQKNLQ